ncbi:dehydrogenase with different specificitie [Aspergillus steynii IBT 23096]|uniref:Dehydrogenase with different specificitie n=1 Tax=Aspergillus steynii IBT 23096 TaxID=1392250 RepID=A0A2I2GL54_9EURO|nr:dehydrogenase with different specificitie [Aspergillus steynii IBT 23096]PLB53601.1 dehydrogenase with different specificitie [Aspergillus steynii IBT 23096]
MVSYSGKKAIIIGGSHGIGLSTAQLLVDRGAQVLVTGRSPDPICTAQEQLGHQAHVVACDISSVTAIADLIPVADTFFGPGARVDLIFINAGYAALEPFHTVTEDSFRRTFDTNVFGAFFAAQKLAPLVKDGGALVFTTSVANQVGIPGMATYAAAKAAVQSLVQTLAAELTGHGVRVNAVSPGFVRTPTMGVASASADDRAAFEGEGVQATPLGRIGDPEEIARAVLFLGFDATFTTGSQVVLDGGLASLQVH